MGLIYQAKNLVNGKRYVGQTRKTLEQRKSIHKYNTKTQYTYFYRALKKYSFNNFEWSVLESDIDPENLNDREVLWIAELDTFGPGGYNMTTGGKQGTERSEETRRKISTTHKGKTFSKEHKRNLSIAHQGKKMSKKAITKMADSLSCFWQITDLQGKTFVIKNLRKFCRENGLSSSGMTEVSQGRQKHHKGWKCRKIEE